jgi:hypothetical protein
MSKEDYYSKDDVYNFLSSQGLVYSGLDKHYDEWFESKYELYFEKHYDDKYVLIDEE